MRKSCEMKGKIRSINISAAKGVAKVPVERAVLVVDAGIRDDAHAAPGDRQVSFLAWERIENFGGRDFRPGVFAENITTKGIDLKQVKLGYRIVIGRSELQISKIGKACHSRCDIFEKIGDCLMPKEGVFAAVAKGGEIKVGDDIYIVAR